jgi:GNAT superfamily N-acetyltransferase
MSDVKIVKINDKSGIKKFVKFQWEVYKGYKYWVPPLLMDRYKILDRNKNPFFKHGDMQLFLAYRDDKIVGRIAAIRNDLHNEIHNDKVGFWGFFEAFEDHEVVNALFDAAKNWLKERGFDTMRGPYNPTVNDDLGLLIEGFDDEPRILMTYNPPYYLSLLENYGFKKAKDLFAYDISNEEMSKNEKIKRVAKIASQRSGMTLRPIDLKNVKKEVEKIKYVYNKAWQPNWGFVPLTDAEMDALAKDLVPIVEKDLAVFGEINGEVVAFALALPDYNAVFKKMNGRLFPTGIFHLLFGKKAIKWVRILILGVIPEYQRRGLDAVLYNYILETAAKHNWFHGEASWILEDNEMMNRGAEEMNGKLYKKYRILEMNI